MDALEPIGAGSVECESLSSYVQRLAAEHGTYPGQLVFRIFAWIEAAQPEKIGSWARHSGRVRLGCSNNSGAHADTWLRLLQKFTGRADLSALTTRRWDNLFPTRGFQASSLYWCPACLAEDTVPFHRLYWMMQPGRVCPKHRRFLRFTCVRCGKPIPALHDRSLVLHCPWCFADLRSDDASSVHPIPGDFHAWCAAEVSTVVALSADGHRSINWEPKQAFHQLGATRQIASAATFGRFVGVNKLTAWYWLSGKSRPSLPASLHVFYRFGMSLAGHIFGGNTEKVSVAPASGSQGEIHLSRVRHPRVVDWTAMRTELESELGRPLAEAPTLRSVASRCGIACRSLRMHERELCLKISARRRARVREEKRVREEALSREIHEALRAFADTHAAPRWRDIEHALGRPGLFNSRYARLVLERVLKSEAPTCNHSNTSPSIEA